MGLEEAIRSGKFIVTAEICPPKGTDISGLFSEVALLQGIIDAVNVTDCPRAMVRMSPLVLSSELIKMNIDTIMHLTCRDRNRIAIQSDLLAAHALGIRNVLAMSGDFTTMGDHPYAKPVFDLDSVQMLQVINKMNRGFDLMDNPLGGATSLYAGAVVNPGARPLGFVRIKLQKKISAGARFIQTQAVFDADLFNEFMDEFRSLNIPVIAGIIPLRSAKSAGFMIENIPGVKIPQAAINRMESTSDPVTEGLKIAAETIDRIKENCQGVHIMPIGNHDYTKRLLEMCSLL
jgi:5,10-methylenetetrahydrofolate reductase